jgi:hypothetical protein
MGMDGAFWLKAASAVFHFVGLPNDRILFGSVGTDILV